MKCDANSYTLFFSNFFNYVVNRLLFYDFPRKIFYYVNPLSNYFYYLNIVTFKSLEYDHRCSEEEITFW